jgi:hypothetical protein
MQMSEGQCKLYDRTRFTWIYFIRNKNNVFEYFKEFKNIVVNLIEKHINIFRSDQEGEYTLGDFIIMCVGQCKLRTRFTWIYFIRNKNNVFEYFKEFKNIVVNLIRKHT